MTFSSGRWSVGAVASAVVPVLVAILATSSPSAQSLGELAAKEARRRQEVGAGKRYTTEDLPVDSGSTPLQAMPAEQPEASKAPVPAEAPAESTPAGETPPPKELRDEKYWRMRTAEIRTKIEQIRSQVTALDRRLKDLSSDSGTSPTERDVAQRALARARQDAESMKGEWDRFEARARLNKVPADWLQ
jgi:hypothetical protein